MKVLLRLWVRWRRKLAFSLLALAASCVAFLLSNHLFHPKAIAEVAALLNPAPTQPIGHYDYFGKLLSPDQAAALVRSRGLNPRDPNAYLQVGAVRITQALLDRGELIFNNRKIGDTFGLQGVFGFGDGLSRILPEVGVAIAQLQGQPTTDLKITLQKPLTLGSRTFAPGDVISTGLDVEAGGRFPIGLLPTGELTCAICHITVGADGKRLKGVPNGNVGANILTALATNSAAGFARLSFNLLDPKYKGNGVTILNSQGRPVELPDPDKFEAAFDNAILDVPYGQFESSPDGLNNTTQIPNVFTFKSGPYGMDGQFAVGPFAGLGLFNNAVHSSEINLLAAAQLSAETLGIDPEVYLGVALQNAAVPALRLPRDGVLRKPSEWLRAVAPDPRAAELQDQIPTPGAGTYPNLSPSLATFNGLIFSPPTGTSDIASGPFLFANNAMAAWQNSLVPPPNRSPENQQALQSGSVQRGARVFDQAGCVTCHVPPFFTDNKIHPIEQIQTNPVRAQSRLAINALLVPPKLYGFNTPVPPPANATVIDVPTQGISDSPTTLPKGILPNGGYKTPSLRGLYLSAPYLHDGGVAVHKDALQPGTANVIQPSGLGLPGTLVQALPADPANSLRALVDRNLRQFVVGVNQSYPPVVRNNLDGKGHNFYVDAAAGYSLQQQTDLINFLLALDDKPGEF